MTEKAPLVLFTRDGCHLCEQAAMALDSLGLAWRPVDIGDDTDLEARYGLTIPVVRCERTKKELCFPFGEAQLRVFEQECSGGS